MFEVLKYSNCLFLVKYMANKYVLSFCRYHLFTLLMICIAAQFFNLMKTQSSTFAFVSWAFGSYSRTAYSLQCPEVFPLFYSSCLIVLCLVFTYLTYFELIFVNGKKYHLVWFFQMYIPTLPSSIYWKDSFLKYMF